MNTPLIFSGLMILYGLIFISAGLLLIFKPPKKINGIYGYRTARSMKSQESWNFAQHFSGIQMRNAGFALCASSLIGLIIPLNETLSVTLSLVFLLVAAALLVLRTERELKTKFGRT
jgi:uncharacterized membrane protein